MTIQTSNEHQRAFSDSEMDERVVWDDYQRADLDDDLENYLVETYDSITHVDEDEEIGEPEEEIEEVFSVEEKAAEAVGEREEDVDPDSDYEPEGEDENEGDDSEG